VPHATITSMNSMVYDISVVSVGLFAGLMMTLVFLLQRQWMKQQKNEYAQYFKQFLLVAKGHPLITLLSFTSFIGPLYLAIQSPSDTMALWAAGLVFFVGCFVVTVFLNLPIYRRVIAWRTTADYANWKEVRMRFFILNIVRFVSALVSLVLLLSVNR
jgi:uncharacterized membrane protein